MSGEKVDAVFLAGEGEGVAELESLKRGIDQRIGRQAFVGHAVALERGRHDADDVASAVKADERAGRYGSLDAEVEILDPGQGCFLPVLDIVEQPTQVSGLSGLGQIADRVRYVRVQLCRGLVFRDVRARRPKLGFGVGDQRVLDPLFGDTAIAAGSVIGSPSRETLPPPSHSRAVSATDHSLRIAPATGYRVNG